jgi:hypothetical protein
MYPKNKTVFVLHDRKSGEAQGVYSRACHDDYEFSSEESARSSNCHDVYKNTVKYRVAKYRVTYELIDDDVSPMDD